jgi:hypothetical protein
VDRKPRRPEGDVRAPAWRRASARRTGTSRDPSARQSVPFGTAWRTPWRCIPEPLRVDATRLRAKGYGFYCPIDPDHDEDPCSKNRRVEFMIVKTSRGPTGVTLGCANAAAHGVKSAPVP